MRSWFVLSVLALALSATAVPACDSCGIYACAPSLDAQPGWSFGLHTRYTRFDRLQLDGESVPDPGNSSVDSWITDVVVGYQTRSRWALQLHAPLVYRAFARPVGEVRQTGTVSGLGDTSLMVLYRAAEGGSGKGMFRLTLGAGVKFPTGDSSRIAEELSEGEETGPPSGVHGHDLALGSGSVDGLFGAYADYRRGRWLSSGEVQFAWRGVGSYGYRYADDLTFGAGLGRALLEDARRTLLLQLRLSGETKGKDRMGEAVMEDTGHTELYAGPALTLRTGKRFQADVSLELPVLSHNTALQTVPSLRARLGLAWKL